MIGRLRRSCEVTALALRDVVVIDPFEAASEFWHDARDQRGNQPTLFGATSLRSGPPARQAGVGHVRE